MTLTDAEARVVAGILLAALRLLPATLLSPFLGGPLVPPPVRIGLALALGAVGLRGAGASPGSFGGVALAAAAARELSLGVLLGLGAMLPLEAARAGGRLVDTLRGATLSELHVAPIRQRESATGDLLAQWCVVLAAWTGGDRLIVQGLLGTFASLPPGAPLPSTLLGAGGVRLASELMAAALAIAAPAAAGVLAADLALGIVERIAPNVGAVRSAQPARAALGLAAIAVAASAVGGRLAALLAFAGRSPSLVVPGGTP